MIKNRININFYLIFILNNTYIYILIFLKLNYVPFKIHKYFNFEIFIEIVLRPSYFNFEICIKKISHQIF